MVCKVKMTLKLRPKRNLERKNEGRNNLFSFSFTEAIVSAKCWQYQERVQRDGHLSCIPNRWENTHQYENLFSSFMSPFEKN